MFVTGESIIGAGMATPLSRMGVTRIGALGCVGVLACGLRPPALRAVATAALALDLVTRPSPRNSPGLY